jgi:lactate dehydrogenase-like 2-hydroxyacid dehydrogenase
MTKGKNIKSSDFSAAFYEVFDEEEKLLKKYLPPNRKYFFTWKTIQEAVSAKIAAPAPIISIRTQSKIPFRWADYLNAIITRSTGYDHISDYIKKTGAPIKCAYLPDYAARAVAEHSLMMWTYLLRKTSHQVNAFKKFHRDGLTGKELRGRKISVVGVGRIGSQIVDIAVSLGMDVCGVDILPRDEIKKKYHLVYLPLLKAVKRAEILVAALPFTKLTEGMLNYRILSQMPRNSIFINVGRGEVSSSVNILKLLEEGHLSGVGLDVYNREKELASVLRDGLSPKKLSSSDREEIEAILKILSHHPSILTPHNAFNTEESVERKSQKTADNLKEFFRNKKFQTPIPF